jgi:hypothetical protein
MANSNSNTGGNTMAMNMANMIPANVANMMPAMPANMSALADVVNDKAAEMFTYAQRQADRVVAPEQRRMAFDRVLCFANDQPLLFVGYPRGRMQWSF